MEWPWKKYHNCALDYYEGWLCSFSWRGYPGGPAPVYSSGLPVIIFEAWPAFGLFRHPEWKITPLFPLFSFRLTEIRVELSYSPGVSSRGSASWVRLHPSCSDECRESSEHPAFHTDTKFNSEKYVFGWELLGLTLLTFISNRKQH